MERVRIEEERERIRLQERIETNRLRLVSDDVLVIESPDALTADVCERITGQLRSELGIHNRVVVLDSGMRMRVVEETPPELADGFHPSVPDFVRALGLNPNQVTRVDMTINSEGFVRAKVEMLVSVNQMNTMARISRKYRLVEEGP
jgi:hypothetical protein